MNAKSIGEWGAWVRRRRPGARFYERDGKSWDATMSKLHHLIKMELYKMVGPEFAEFFDKSYEVKGTYRNGDVRIVYKVAGTTKSGHNDTTLGNSFINAAIIYTAMRRLGLRGSIIVAGDDLLAAIDGDWDGDKLAAEEAACGIIPEFRVFDSIFDVSFISGVWFPGVGDELIFTPKPGRLLSKLFWTVKPPSPKVAKEVAYVSGVAVGMLFTCADLPVIGPFLRSHVADAHAKPIFKHTFTDHRAYAHPRVLDHFCYRYQTSPSEVREVEDLILSARGAACIVRHPLLMRMCCQDLSGIHLRPARFSSVCVL